MAALDAVGSVFSMASAVAALALPTTGEPVHLAVVNGMTTAGAVCVFVGAWLSLPDGGQAGA